MGPPDPRSRWLRISPTQASPAANTFRASEAGLTPLPAWVPSWPPNTRLARHLTQPAFLCFLTEKMALGGGTSWKCSLPWHFGPCWQPWAFPGKIEIPKAGSPGLLEAEQRKSAFNPKAIKSNRFLWLTKPQTHSHLQEKHLHLADILSRETLLPGRAEAPACASGMQLDPHQGSNSKPGPPFAASWAGTVRAAGTWG